MEPFRFTMQKVSDTLIEGAYVGHLDEQDVAAVDETDRLLAHAPGRVVTVNSTGWPRFAPSAR